VDGNLRFGYFENYLINSYKRPSPQYDDNEFQNGDGSQYDGSQYDGSQYDGSQYDNEEPNQNQNQNQQQRGNLHDNDSVPQRPQYLVPMQYSKQRVVDEMIRWNEYRFDMDVEELYNIVSNKRSRTRDQQDQSFCTLGECYSKKSPCY
jgi:hypothetical protein